MKSMEMEINSVQSEKSADKKSVKVTIQAQLTEEITLGDGEKYPMVKASLYLYDLPETPRYRIGQKLIVEVS